MIIFDEPTEHLDEPTAAELTRDLLAAAAGRTAIFITHRPELMAAVAPAVTVDLGGAAAGTASPAADVAERSWSANAAAPVRAIEGGIVAADASTSA